MNPFSYIKNSLYKIKNKRRLTEDVQAQVCGFSVASASMTFSGDKLMLRAAINAVIMFALVFGLALSFIIPFEINANIGAVGLFTFIFAVFFAFINCKKLWQSIGYILFFVLFTAFLITFRSYVNSGLNGTLNDFYEKITDLLDFTRIRTYNEQFPEQHYMAVTTFILVIVSAFMLLINFTFNNEQSPLTILVIIFPFLQMAMYVDLFSGMASFFLITFAVIMTLALRHNFQHHLPLKKKNVFYFRRKKEIYEAQISSGRVTGHVLGYVAAIMFVFSVIIAVLLPEKSFNPTKDELALKEGTKPTVTKVLMYGLSSLFMHEGDTWMNSSADNLGQVGTVYQDFETDLEVTFTPYQYDTVYLRSSTYSTYWGTQWKKGFIDDYQPERPFRQTEDMLTLEAEEDSSILRGKMHIDVVDYIVQHDEFLPYYGTNQLYTDKNQTVPFVSGKYQPKRDLNYIAVQDFWNSKYAKKADETEPSELDKIFINNSLFLYGSPVNPDMYSYSIYDYVNPDDENISPDWITQTPEYIDLKKTLDQICEEQGFSGSTYEIINQIQSYLKENFTYSLNPGKTPAGEDFVTYFLTDSKKGYCVYFATAGCLLLRNMGIPARYCEGYALDMSAVINGETITTEKYEDWISGEATVGKTAVVKAPLTDANAHAWCEVYVAGFGWVPVEFTVAGTMDESDKAAWSIWDDLSNLGGDNANNALANLLGANVGAVFTWIGKILIALAILAIPFIGYKVYKNIKNNKDPNAISYPANNRTIMKSYQGLVKKLRKKDKSVKENPLPRDVAEILIRNGLVKEKADRICELYRIAAFSPKEIDDNLVTEFKKLLREGL